MGKNFPQGVAKNTVESFVEIDVNVVASFVLIHVLGYPVYVI